MPDAHVIRLRGPWDYLPLARVVREVDGDYRLATDDLPPGGTVRVPSDWSLILGHDFRGTVRYTRRFNCPTNLDSGERVWLVIEAVDFQAEVMLNEHILGSVQGFADPQRFDITRVLEPHNTVTVDVTLPAEVFRDSLQRPGRAGAAGGLIGEVRLEIEPGGN